MARFLQYLPLFTLILLFAVVAADPAATTPHRPLPAGVEGVEAVAQGGRTVVRFTPPAGAGQVVPTVPPPSGSERAPRPFPLRSDPQVQRLSTDVRIVVDGDQRVARVEVEEQFRNNGHRLAEGDYLYPIPTGAVFTDLSLFMGEQELKGEMLPAAQARGIYEEIVRRKKDPALVELVGHGLLRARVFPIAAGDTRRIILRYTVVLGRDGHLLRLRYPRTVGMFEGDERPVEEVMVTHGLAPVRGLPAATLEVRVSDAHLFATPYSPTHRIEIRERDADEIDIDATVTGGGPDFDLLLPLRDSAVGAGVVSHAPVGDNGFYMLLVSPPVDGEGSATPRDVTLVLDVSGSMSGDKIVQARAALDQLLSGLGEQDRFRLITFSSAVRRFRQDWTAATFDELIAARDWLARVEAGGSTNVEAALVEALRPPAAPERMSQVIFLTDGKPTIGETAPERIVAMVEEVRDDERIFGFGVGHDVNTYLLDAMASGGRGSVNYVAPGESVEEAISSLSRKISRPALADLRIVRAPVMLEDAYPQQIPDLFYGEDLVLLGRYRGAGAGELVIEGTRAGVVERHSFRVDFAAEEPGNDFIPKLWAARKAAALTTQVRLRGADPELIEEIRQLGLRYGVLTDYTSYLVEEPGMTLDDATLQSVMSRAQAMDVDAEEQSGAEAFRRARRDAVSKRARNLGEAESPVPVVASTMAPAAALAGARNEAVDESRSADGMTRHVGDRVFVLRAGVWTDLRYGDQRVVRVAPFSEAYFELLERLPQIKPFVALGSRVIIANEQRAVEIDESGSTAWDDALDELVRSFGS